jgi:hypothetical protein
MSKDLDNDFDLELDDILGDAIEVVAGDVDPEIQNDNHESQNDTDDELEICLDIDELADALNETPKENQEDADLGGDVEVNVLADLGLSESVGESDESVQSTDEQDDDLSFLDGGEGLVDGDEDEIDVDSLLGQAKGESDETSEAQDSEVVEDSVMDEVALDTDTDIDIDIDVDSEDEGFDPLSDFSENIGESDEDEDEDDDEDDAVIEPDFEDTDLNDFEVPEDEIAIIEPDIVDGFMEDESLDDFDEVTEPEDTASNGEDDDEMIDISSDVQPEDSGKSSFKPHTEVEDVESILGGGVSGMFKENEDTVSPDVVEEPQLPKSESVDVEESKGKQTQEATERTLPEAVVENASKKGKFGLKAIVVTAVASVVISLGFGGGVLHFYGDKIMSNTSYVDSEALDTRMAEFAKNMELRLSAKTEAQASKDVVELKFKEVNSALDAVMARYDSDLNEIQEQQKALLNRQDVDKVAMEALNRKAMLLMNQFVDDTAVAQAKISEEIYAKVIKVVRDEFSSKDNTVKLDAVLAEVSALKSGQTEIKNRVQTQMNLIGVLESEGDFLSKRMATLEVGGATDSPVQKSGKTPLNTGYNKDEWGYLEVSTKNGVSTSGRFKYGDNQQQVAPSKSLPYILKGVFLAGSQSNPEYKVYVTPRASKNATPMGYKIGQQIPGMGKILKVEPTSGNEKIPYLVYTDLGVLRGEQ